MIKLVDTKQYIIMLLFVKDFNVGLQQKRNFKSGIVYCLDRSVSIVPWDNINL